MQIPVQTKNTPKTPTYKWILYQSIRASARHPNQKQNPTTKRTKRQDQLLKKAVDNVRKGDIKITVESKTDVFKYALSPIYLNGYPPLCHPFQKIMFAQRSPNIDTKKNLEM